MDWGNTFPNKLREKIMKKNKKHLKALKRKKKLLQKRNHDALRHQFSSGTKTMYHFTNIHCMDGIKKYGLCIGNVATGFCKEGKRKVGKNGVNLTEEGHYHDPACYDGKNIYRITVEMNCDDSSMFNARKWAKAHDDLHLHTINEGNVYKHWYYFGQIETKDFIAVHKWTGKEFIEVSLDFLRTPNDWSSYSLLRLVGQYLDDKSGYAKEASDLRGDSSNFKKLYAVTDKVNEMIWGTELHHEFQTKVVEIGNNPSDIFKFASTVLDYLENDQRECA
jgi:hypothetical protein